ncbi:hypothetical protein ACJRO7_031465 [Eucalyptus globulus]|uniref:Uncharacterized protein n=1 Tax=Eucalyptus globulus TaxID=34317 RepID=A0ABD3JIV6_EUCGL
MDKSRVACESQAKAFLSGDGARVKSRKPSWKEKIGGVIWKALNLHMRKQKAGAGREMVGRATSSQMEIKRREGRAVKLRPRHHGRRYTCASVGVAENFRTRRMEEWESQLHQYNLLSW